MKQKTVYRNQTRTVCFTAMNHVNRNSTSFLSVMKILYSVVSLENPVGGRKMPSWQNIFSQLEKYIFSVG